MKIKRKRNRDWTIFFKKEKPTNIWIVPSWTHVDSDYLKIVLKYFNKNKIVKSNLQNCLFLKGRPWLWSAVDRMVESPRVHFLWRYRYQSFSFCNKYEMALTRPGTILDLRPDLNQKCSPKVYPRIKLTDQRSVQFNTRCNCVKEK